MTVSITRLATVTEVTRTADTTVVTRSTSPVVVSRQVAGIQGPAGPAAPIIYNRESDLQVVTGVTPFRFPFAARLVGMSAALVTPSDPEDVVVDILLDGVTIFDIPVDRLTIPAGDNDADEVTLNVPVPAGTWLTVDITQIGSVTPGSNLTVIIRYEKE